VKKLEATTLRAHSRAPAITASGVFIHSCCARTLSADMPILIEIALKVILQGFQKTKLDALHVAQLCFQHGYLPFQRRGRRVLLRYLALLNQIPI
jgi:hypothetical protein